MKAFGVDIEATVHILKFDSSEAFIYRELAQISRDANKTVEFSLLIHVKQTKPVTQGAIQVFFVHLRNDSSRGNQKYARLHVGEISLCNSDITNPTDNHDTFLSDQWNIRKTFHWNIQNVPTEGLGSYAVVLSVGQNDAIKRDNILDCAYFTVI